MSAATIHVCAPTGYPMRRIRWCPTCETRRRFVATMYVWYGTTWTCCSCGDAWSDGERLPRPFARGWRTRAASDARRRWATAMTKADAMRMLADDLDAGEQ